MSRLCSTALEALCEQWADSAQGPVWAMSRFCSRPSAGNRKLWQWRKLLRHAYNLAFSARRNRRVSSNWARPPAWISSIRACCRSSCRDSSVGLDRNSSTCDNALPFHDNATDGTHSVNGENTGQELNNVSAGHCSQSDISWIVMSCQTPRVASGTITFSKFFYTRLKHKSLNHKSV